MTMGLDQVFFKYGVYYPVVRLQGQKVYAYLQSLKESQWGPPENLEQIQTMKLRALLAYAKSKVPYYQKTLSRAVNESSFSRESIDALPFVAKSDLQNSQSQFLRLDGSRGLARKTTGGSTGQAVTIWKTPDAVASESAANWRGFEWAGIDIGDRQARFWGTPYSRKDRLRASVTDFITHRKRCSAFSFNEADMREYTATLNRFRPRYFYGYVSMLAAYAEYLRSSGDRLQFDLEAVIPTSEVLTSYHRTLFEQAFGARVFNEYGCGELGTIAHECERGAMHVNAENLLVEILRGEKACPPHEVGEIVVTELNNTGMPLIRYRLGDFAAFSDAPCPCGRTLPVIENIAGRAYDLIYNKDGRMFHGEFFMYIFEEVKRRNLGIRSFQVIQEDFDNIVVKIVPANEYDAEAESLIRTRIQDGYGKDAEITFVRVSEIPRERSGKMRLIVGMKSSATERSGSLLQV